MSSTKEELENLINEAIKKVGGYKENELCKYLPVSTGGYMHHFTFRKMKKRNPEELMGYIKKHIINGSPSVVSPKKRAARGSRKRRDQLIFSRNQLERMLNIAKLAGDNEIINILSPKKSLASAKRDLINSIRQNRVEPDLWNAYVECSNSMNSQMNQESQLANS